MYKRSTIISKGIGRRMHLYAFHIFTLNYVYVQTHYRLIIILREGVKSQLQMLNQKEEKSA